MYCGSLEGGAEGGTDSCRYESVELLLKKAPHNYAGGNKLNHRKAPLEECYRLLRGAGTALGHHMTGRGSP